MSLSGMIRSLFPQYIPDQPVPGRLFVELFGHGHVTGTAREVTMLGRRMLEVSEEGSGHIRFLSPRSIFSMQPLASGEDLEVLERLIDGLGLKPLRHALSQITPKQAAEAQEDMARALAEGGGYGALRLASRNICQVDTSGISGDSVDETPVRSEWCDSCQEYDDICDCGGWMS